MKEESIRLQLLRPTLGSHLSSVAPRPDVEYHSRSMRGDPITMVTVIAGTQFVRDHTKRLMLWNHVSRHYKTT